MYNSIICKTLRINHYVKNIVVFVPLIFSLNLFNLNLGINSIKVFIAFCAISSVVYILNDLIDLKQDKIHPIKCLRPIASGKITFMQAILFLIILLILSIALSFFNKMAMSMIIIYLILNIFYSLYLKHIPIVDASCIAFGFIFRILVGCFAISVKPSPLVILLTFFLSLFFTYTKRKLEYKLVANSFDCRKSLQGFNEDLLNQFVIINAVLSIAFYLTYVLENSTIVRVGTEYLYITVVPFALIIYRLLYLTNTANNDDPIWLFCKDMQIKILIILYLLFFMISILLGRI